MAPEVTGAIITALSISLVGAGVLLLAFQVRIDRKIAADRAELIPV